jgi:putative flavoprotein involved in K+ transport
VVHRTDVLIIGAGQAGLAMSHCLTGMAIDHVIIERGEVGERWRSQRWDSLNLLTPNWMTRLPGYAYGGPDPDGFMHRLDVAAFLDGYRHSFAAPVVTHTQVLAVTAADGGYRVTTDQGEWLARAVVVATGACDLPSVPEFAAGLPADIRQVMPENYHNPETLPAGGVLVVGASATGIQLADEIHRSGRPVTVAAGQHIRIPRHYRGRDIMAWLDACGFLFDQRRPGADAQRLNGQPSLQLVGRADRLSLDLPHLAEKGVRVLGHATGVSHGTVTFAHNLAEELEAAEQRRRRLLARIDSFIVESGTAAPEDPLAWLPPERFGCFLSRLDLRAAGIRSVVWATGYRRHYPWLELPVFDGAGEIRNTGGVTELPGLYVIGLPFMRHRSSTFIDGVGRDAAFLAGEVARGLNHSTLHVA